MPNKAPIVCPLVFYASIAPPFVSSQQPVNWPALGVHGLQIVVHLL